MAPEEKIFFDFDKEKMSNFVKMFLK